MIAFGPIPSRRLGRSLGINNIPPKFCTYSCVYCQVGRTNQLQARRRAFYDPRDILTEIKYKVKKAAASGEPVDYLTFVPDGEPTLDTFLGYEIELLKSLEIRIAVITNASLLWQKDVRVDLMKADWVSLKVDAVQMEIWKQLNRPHGRLTLEALKYGMLEFAGTYRGTLVTETMLIKGLNDRKAELEATGDFIKRVNPATAYISVPTRPPAESWVHPPAENSLTRAYRIFSDRINCVEYLIGYEGNAFAYTGNVEQDLLNIIAVHPMKEEAVSQFLSRGKADWSVIEKLLAEDLLVETEYEGERFFVRKFPREKRRV